MGSSMIDRSLPLIDLHRHFDGYVRLTTILDLGARNDVKLPATTVEKLRPFVQVIDRQPGVMAFIAKMLWRTAALGNADACRRVARGNVEDAQREHLA